MNKKRGLKRVWVVVSVFFVISCGVMMSIDNSDEDIVAGLVFMVSGLLVWWGLFYSGIWISSGFSGDDKKKGEINE